VFHPIEISLPLKFSEPKAIAVHCVHLTDVYKLKPSQTFIICNARGGTVVHLGLLFGLPLLCLTVAVFPLGSCSLSNSGSDGKPQNSRDVCAFQGKLQLSISYLHFYELMWTLLADHPAYLDAASLAYFMHSFSKTEKIMYQGEEQDST